MKNFSLLYLTIIFSLIIIGCVQPTPHDADKNGKNEDNTASFYISEIKNQKIAKTNRLKNWAIPQAKLYTFSTCVKENITNNKLPGHPFVIKNGTTEIPTETDSDGCLSWTQEISYNFLAHSKYVLLKGHIQSKGTLKGQRPFIIALNPWSSDRGFQTPEVVDLRKSSAIPDGSLVKAPEDVDKTLKGINAKNEITQRFIWAPQLSYTNIELGPAKTGGIKTKVQLSLKPSIILSNIYGANYEYSLQKGLFDVWTRLVAVTVVNGKYIRIPLTRSVAKQEASIVNGQLDINILTILENQVRKGTLELAVRLIPKNAPTGLKKLEGVYRLGSTESLFKTQTAQLQQELHNVNQSFDLQEDYIKHLLQVDQQNSSNSPSNVIRLKKPISFFVNKINGTSIREKISPQWRLTQARKYTFTACLKNNLNSTSIKKGQDFLIQINNKQIPLKTEGDGCLSWNEVFHYDSLSKATNILIERNLIGKTNHYGTQKIRFIINPWNKDHKINSPEFIDQTTKSSPKISAKLFKTEKEAQSHLMGTYNDHYAYLNISKVSTKIYQTHKSVKGTNLKLILNLQPQLIVFDHLGNAQPPKALESGRFKIVPYIVSVRPTKKNATDRVLLSKLINPGQTLTSINNFQLNASIDIMIPKRYNDGSLELGLQLIPIGAKNSIKSFEGIFDLGSSQKITGGTAYLKESLMDKDFIFQRDYLNKISYIENIKDTTNTYSIDAFELKNIDVKFESIKWQTATKRVIKFSVKANIEDGFDGHEIKYEDFKIRIKSNPHSFDLRKSDKVLPRTTQSHGEIEWTDTIHHKYYSTERYLKKTIVLEHKSGFKKTYEFYINPWDRGWTFGNDSEKYTDKDIKEMEKRNANALPSRLIISRYKIETLDFSYAIDKFLTLEVNKRFQLQIDPRVLRDSLTRGSNADEPLRDGVYLLRVAVKKAYFEATGKANDFISPVQKLVTVKNGRITTPVTFTVRDMRLMRLRGFLAIQLETVDLDKANSIGQHFKGSYDDRVSRDFSIKDLKKYNNINYESIIDYKSGLNSRTFIGPIIMLSNSFSSGMRPTDDLEESSCSSPDCNQLSIMKFSPTNVTKIPLKKLYSLSHDDAKGYKIKMSYKNVTVKQLIEQWTSLEKTYIENMEKASSLSSFIKENNLEAVQLSQTPSKNSFLKDFTPKMKQKYNKIFTQDNNVESLMKALNFSNSIPIQPNLVRDFRSFDIYQNTQVEEKDLSNLFKTGKMSPILTLRMCQLFFDQIINFPNKDGVRLLDKEKDPHYFLKKSRDRIGPKADVFIRRCSRTLMEGLTTRLAKWKHLLQHEFSKDKPFEQGEIPFPFSIDKKLKIHRVKKVIESTGSAMNFSVNTGFNESSGENKSNNLSTFTSPLKWIKGLTADLLSGIGFSISTSRSIYKSRASNSGASAGVYLSTQIKKVLLDFAEYETCIAIKLNPEFLSWKGNSVFSRLPNIKYIVNKDYDANSAIERFTRGLLICSGEVIQNTLPQNNTPKYFRETYYYTTQHFTEGDILDFSHLMNHPWLISVRGLTTFTSFIKQLDGRHLIWQPDSLSWRYPTLDDQKETYELGFYPMKQLELAYASHIPNTPGFYTVMPEETLYLEDLQSLKIDPHKELLDQEDQDRWSINSWLKLLQGD